MPDVCFETQKSSDTIYTRQPVRIFEDIPVFCQVNEYQDNYEQIAHDHLQAEAKGAGNPFMDPVLWDEIEDHTVQMLSKYLRSSAQVLDVGVGTGRLLSKLGDGLEKFGVDISEQYLRVAAQKQIRVCMAFVEDLPYPDSFFDAVISTDVLEHVLDLNSAVKEMLRVVKPGGILAIRVPYRESLKAYLKSPYKYVHLRNFDEYSLILLFEKIFDAKVLEYQTSGGAITREHLWGCGPNVPKMAWFLAIHFSKFLSTNVWRWLAQRFYPHSEITVVVQKKPASS